MILLPDNKCHSPTISFRCWVISWTCTSCYILFNWLQSSIYWRQLSFSKPTLTVLLQVKLLLFTIVHALSAVQLTPFVVLIISGDLKFWKGVFQYARVAHLLVESRGNAPPTSLHPGKFCISDLLRLFLVLSWGEIAKVWRPTAKHSCCVWSPQN